MKLQILILIRFYKCRGVFITKLANIYTDTLGSQYEPARKGKACGMKKELDDTLHFSPIILSMTPI